MACGDKYRWLLRAGGGRTIDKPYRKWCNEVDAKAWHAQAGKVFGLQRAAWNALMRAEKERAEGHEGTDRLRADTTAYEDDYDTLPPPSMWMAFGFANCAEVVHRYTANLEHGICVLENLNAALAEYEISPVGSGGGGGSKSRTAAWVVGSILAAGVLGAGVTVALRSRSRTALAEATP